MGAEPNIVGMGRLLYLAAGAAVAGWGLWGADPGWTQWTWLVLGGALLVLSAIGYSPVHALFMSKHQKAV
jgi:hypothetical protein